MDMRFLIYGTRTSKDKSGAYLFLPDGEAKVAEVPHRTWWLLWAGRAWEGPAVPSVVTVSYLTVPVFTDLWGWWVVVLAVALGPA